MDFKPALPEEQKKRAAHLKAQGWSTSDVAKDTDILASTINANWRTWARQYGIDLPAASPDRPQPAGTSNLVTSYKVDPETGERLTEPVTEAVELPTKSMPTDYSITSMRQDIERQATAQPDKKPDEKAEAAPELEEAEPAAPEPPAAEIQKFANEKFGEIRTVTINDEPWFVANDVARTLGYANPRDALLKHVDSEDKGVAKCDTLGGEQEMTIINESGLYALILSSKLESAKEFKRWVTGEVLPSIRKHGGYIAGQRELSPEELMAKALLVARQTLADREARLSALTVENQIMKPKADYFDELVDRNLLTNLRETAKQLEVREKSFICFLLNRKYLYRDQRGRLMPYAQYTESGLFAVKETFNEKTSWSGTQTLVTPKGRETFRLLMLKGTKN